MKKYFLEMIVQARNNCEVVLYKNILDIPAEKIDEAIHFLEAEYEKESLSYPYTVPVFDKDAAIWAAHLFYISSQLLLFREHKIDEVESLIPVYEKEKTAGAMLSVDLTLRFIPNILLELKLIDNTDFLIDILEKHLYNWHYSAIGYQLTDTEGLDMTIIESDNCLKQMYINRVIEKDAKQLAQHPIIKPLIESTLGIYTKELWTKFE